MKIRVEVSGYFDKYIDKCKFDIDIPSGVNIDYIIQILRIPKDEIGFVIADNKKVDFSYLIDEGETIGIYPYIVGG